MNPTERRLTQEVKAMTRLEVLKKALEGRITWQQAADIYRCLQQARSSWRP